MIAPALHAGQLPWIMAAGVGLGLAMWRDLIWGIGGGLLIISLGQLAGWTGLLGSMQVAPLIAGGAALILLTLIVLASRLERSSEGPGNRPKVTPADGNVSLCRMTLVMEGRWMLRRWVDAGEPEDFARFLSERGFFLELEPHMSAEFKRRLGDALARISPCDEPELLSQAFALELARLEQLWSLRFERVPNWGEELSAAY